MPKQNFDQAKITSLYSSLRDAGKSNGDIASALNEKKYTTQRGGKITAQWLSRTVRNLVGNNGAVAQKTENKTRGSKENDKFTRYATIGVLNDRSLSDSDKVKRLKNLYL